MVVMKTFQMIPYINERSHNPSSSLSLLLSSSSLQLFIVIFAVLLLLFFLIYISNCFVFLPISTPFFYHIISYAVVGLSDSSTIHMVRSPYDLRGCRIHVRRLNELLS